MPLPFTTKGVSIGLRQASAPSKPHAISPNMGNHAITRLPSVTGVAEAGLLVSCTDSNFSAGTIRCQRILPSRRSMQIIRGLFSSMPVRKMRSPQTTGDETPGGTGVFQATALSTPNSLGGLLDSAIPWLRGPRNCGHDGSSASACYEQERRGEHGNNPASTSVHGWQNGGFTADASLAVCFKCASAKLSREGADAGRLRRQPTGAPQFPGTAARPAQCH